MHEHVRVFVHALDFSACLRVWRCVWMTKEMSVSSLSFSSIYSSVPKRYSLTPSPMSAVHKVSPPGYIYERMDEDASI